MESRSKESRCFLDCKSHSHFLRLVYISFPLFSQRYLTIHQPLLLQVSGLTKAELSGRLSSVCCVLYLGGLASSLNTACHFFFPVLPLNVNFYLDLWIHKKSYPKNV